MDLVDVSLAAAYCAVAHYNYVLNKTVGRVRKRLIRRRCWMNTLNRNRSWLSMEKQLSELVKEPNGDVHEFTRISQEDFEYLLDRIAPFITKKNTQMRKAIPAKIRLGIALRYLAAGDSYEGLHYMFRVSTQLVSQIVPEVCDALNQVLKDEIKIPSTVDEWLNIERGFQTTFPRCAGVLDVKRMAVQYPAKSDDKKLSHTVLLALVDGNSNFIYVDIGSQERTNDGHKVLKSTLWERISTGTLNLPAAHPLQDVTANVPHVLLGDGTLSLSKSVMSPYAGVYAVGSPESTFNEALTRTRTVADNAFGVLCTRFKILQKPLGLCPRKVTVVTMACILLHNFLRKSNTSSPIYTPPGTIDYYEGYTLVQPGSWRNEMSSACVIRDLPMVGSPTETEEFEVRKAFTKFFSNTECV